MAIVRRTIGTKLTKREVVSLSPFGSREEKKLFLKLREKDKQDHDLDHVLAKLKADALDTLEAAGLPTGRMHEQRPDGTWREVSDEEIYAEWEKEEKEPGVTYIDGSRFRNAARVIEEKGFECDSPEGYAIRILGCIGSQRGWQREARRTDLSAEWRERAPNRVVIEAIKLGKMLREREFKAEWEPKMLSGGRKKKDTTESDIAIAKTYLNRKALIESRGGTASPTFIKELVGKEGKPPLKRRAAMNAVKRGLRALGLPDD